jgi:hypothetical protein
MSYDDPSYGQDKSAGYGDGGYGNQGGGGYGDDTTGGYGGGGGYGGDPTGAAYGGGTDDFQNSQFNREDVSAHFFRDSALYLVYLFI